MIFMSKLDKQNVSKDEEKGLFGLDECNISWIKLKDNFYKLLELKKGQGKFDELMDEWAKLDELHPL